MAHPFNKFRQSNVERSRVADITSGYAGGGVQKPGLTADPVRQRATGGAVMDDEPMAKRRASGGRAKKASVVVNVISGGQPQPPAPPPIIAGPPPGPPMPPPGGPPMGMKPPMPGAGPGMPPPDMPMRARGGGVKSVGMKVGTPVEHDKGKTDTDDMRRPGMKMKPKVITFKTGGGVVSFKAGGKVKMDAGTGSGEGRLEQAARTKRNYHGPLK